MAASSSSSSSSQCSRLFAIMAIVVIILNVTLFMPIVSARYLPTRSNDQLRRQEIKEILRLLLDLPGDETISSQRDSQLGWMNGGREAAYDMNSAIRVARNIQGTDVAGTDSMMANNQRSKRSTLLKSG
ncbi:uncharacterized protein LOC124496298 [Dermatophagoides farinae]|uniref:Uncharacterized protein n=1 Tax=Dermatophagoides farinae TaxID=6954 RepID=A0A922HXP3_DERFA|nr:uncharacterized protein LOC124496298 [Dermatophagoides farinae]XP_046915773.1 uncharacterized protein LOC124496298 [Dermatophagoides farinae]KAH7645688.1 hypothetical protein HUG17_1226 [Dermatophagoides farinae]KAH9515869.1 hypothetical protein DERF_006644 [Dermatophagoides farinae]